MTPLFTAWPALAPRLRRGRILLLLDFDGTLAPIAATPGRARLTPARRALLRRLAAAPGVAGAVISGRGLADLEKRVGVKGFVYVGNHGFEMRGPSFRWTHPRAEAIRRAVAGTAKALKKSAAGLRGVIVEDKGLTLSVHHRLAAPLAAAAARAALGRALKPGLILRSGRKVWEVRPAARADKGTAARKLLRRSGAARPVCIGDDRTDEDAFKAVKGRGIAVKVLSPETMSAPTAADYSLCSTAEVFKFLKRLLLLRKKAAAALLLATPVCACAAVSTAAFTGGAEFSAVSASGNTEADTFSAKNSLSIERGRLSLDLEASALTARDRAGATAERYAASEKASRLWSGRNFFFERFQWDKDRFSGVKNRYDASLGVGRRLVDGSRNRLSVELGAGYLYEERLRAPKNNFASGRGHAKYTRVLSGTSSLSQEAELVADLGHASDYRLRTDTSATAALSARFSLKASFQWKRVNRPPAGFAKDDKTTSAALIFSY